MEKFAVSRGRTAEQHCAGQKFPAREFLKNSASERPSRLHSAARKCGSKFFGYAGTWSEKVLDATIEWLPDSFNCQNY